MIITKDGEDKGNEKVTQTEAKAETNNARMAPSMNIFQNYSATALPGAATDYIEEVKRIVGDKSNELVIDMTKLTTPAGAVLFHFNKKIGIVLIMDEAIKGINPSLPTAFINREAIDEVRRIYGNDFSLLNCIVVDATMYPKSAHMATHIINLIRTQLSTDIDSFTIQNLSNSNYGIDTTITKVRQFMDSLSPHGVTPRSDIGFIITMKKDMSGQPRLRGYDQEFDIYEPIIGCTAYVEFLQHSADMGAGSYTKFQPIVHITDIQSTAPTQKILPIVIATACDIFIYKQQWQTQFNTFEKGKYNIGNLVMDEDGSPFFAKNVKERQDIVNTYLEKPVIVLDITEGMARIPGIENYASQDPQVHKKMIRMFRDFLGIGLPEEIQPTMPMYTEITGQVTVGANTSDSRNVDYLTVINKMHGQGRVSELLMRYPDPTRRAQLIDEWYGGFNRLYTNHVVIINQQLSAMIGPVVSQQLSMRSSLNTLSGIDLTLSLQMGDAYAQSPINVIGTPMAPSNNGWWNAQY